MNAFIDYIEKSCKSLADNRMTFLYKRSTLDRMNERADEVSRSGLKDEAVIRDLIIDEFGDLVEAYPLFVKEQKRKNRAHFMKYAFPIGGLIFLVLIFAYVTGQKFRTISFFVYMPAVAAMLYIVLAAYGVVTWAGGWPVVFAGLAADLVYIVAVLAYNMKYFMYRQEVEE